MEDTCTPKECVVYRKLKLKNPEECPQFVQSWWKDEKTGDTKLIKDCLNRRMFLMLQNIQNRLTAVEQANEQQRNVGFGLMKIMADAAGQDVIEIPQVIGAEYEESE